MGGVSNVSFFRKGIPDCSNTIIRTQLFSPVPEVLKKLKTGYEIDIKLNKPTGPCVALYKGEVVGTIITKDLIQLISCINSGFKFIAVVRSIDSGVCAITIKNIK